MTAAASDRLFLALWPSDAERAALERASAAWHWPAGARRTRAERLHLTLHFIGAVDASRTDGLRTSLQVPFQPFTLELQQPQLWRGGLAVLCPDTVPAALQRLHARLAGALRAADLPLEDRPYRPHVTFARHAAGARPPDASETVRWEAHAGYWLVRTLPAGKGYERLQQFGATAS